MGCFRTVKDNETRRPFCAHALVGSALQADAAASADVDYDFNTCTMGRTVQGRVRVPMPHLCIRGSEWLYFRCMERTCSQTFAASQIPRVDKKSFH